MKELLLTLCMLFFFTVSAVAGVNINTADLQTLQSIPGIGTAKAKAIIDYRSIHGEFQSIDDLAQVRGISGNLLEQIRKMIEVN